MYLDNEMNSLPSVQRSRQMKTANGCTVSMHFPEAADPKLQTDVAGMLIAVFLKRRSVTHEAGCYSVQSLY